MNLYQDYQVEGGEMATNSHGGKRPGAGRPPGALNRITRPIRELAADQGEASIARLVQLRDEAESEQVRFAAAKELLDRGHGRPRQTIAMEDRSLTIIVDRSCKDAIKTQATALEDHSTQDGSGKL
ncbi:MAG: hypothetical protein NW703_14210 [Nitrospiraceae bacterium]